MVTKTFEVEGYDYPPNLSESLSDWWSSNKEGLFGLMSSSKKDKGAESAAAAKSALMPRSFAQAIAKAAKDSGDVLAALKDQEQQASADEEDEDEDITPLIKMFSAWSECQYKIDQGKAEMDALMAKEFNQKLNALIEEKFKNASVLRRKVEDSRLKFDTMRYEVKLTEQQSKQAMENEKAQFKESDLSSKEEGADANETSNEVGKSVTKTKEEQATNDAAQELLEKLEDEFVSNTTEAVETMGEITDSAELLNLVKLFHNFQLVYHRQCVQDLEASLSTLNELEGEDA